jgi:hypothetical protein
VASGRGQVRVPVNRQVAPMLPRVLTGITETEKICRRGDACHAARCVSPRVTTMMMIAALYDDNDIGYKEHKGVPYLLHAFHYYTCHLARCVV